MGVAGGVCVLSDWEEAEHTELIISDSVASDVEALSPLEDFDDESMLSVLLRLPPIPDSGVVTSLIGLSFSPRGEAELFSPSPRLCLLSSFSGRLTLMLDSEESDDMQVDVTISLSMSRDEAPPPVAQEFDEEFESLRELEFEQGLGVTDEEVEEEDDDCWHVLFRGDSIEHCGELASELVMEAGVEASSERSAAEDTELEFVLNEEEDEDDEEEHSLLFKSKLFAGCGDKDFSVSSSSSCSPCMTVAAATVTGLIRSNSCLIFKFPGI